jgi:ectoine hydrolase
MEDARVWGYADEFVQNPERHPMQDLARKLSDQGLRPARLGVEMDNYYFSANAYKTLVEAMPDTQLVDATALVNWQRAVKSDEEITFMRRAAQISERLVDTWL